MAVNPYDNPELYDVFLLGGQISPGVCTFNFPTRLEGWDVQVPKGSSGGNTVRKDQPPVEFEVTLLLWRDEFVDHFAAWDAWKAILTKPIAKNAPKALDIYHPQLADLQIRSVVVKPHTEPQPLSGKMTGAATVKIGFLEYKPIKTAATVAPNGSTTGVALAGEGAKPDPNADLKAQIANLTAQLQKPGAS